MYAYAANNPVRYIDPDGRSDNTTESLNDEQKKYVQARKLEVLEGLNKIKNVLQSYVDDKEGEVELSDMIKTSINDFLGMTDSKDDVKKIINKLDSLISYIDKLSLENFKYDKDRHESKNAGKKSQWAAYVNNNKLPIYLCPYFFENKSSSKTSAGTLIHEATHIIFKTKDITYDEQECRDLQGKQNLKNAQNWRFFYEKNK